MLSHRVKHAAGLAVWGLLVFAAPNAQAYLADNCYDVWVHQQGRGPAVAECWQFTYCETEGNVPPVTNETPCLYVDGQLVGTWNEHFLLTWLLSGPFSFSCFEANAGSATCRGITFFGFFIARCETEGGSYCILGTRTDCAKCEEIQN